MFKLKFKETTFEKEIYYSVVKFNICILFFLMLYLFCYANVAFVNMWKAFLFGVVCSFFIIVCVVLFTNRMITKNVSDKIESWKIFPIDIHERTELVRQIYKMPARISIEVFLSVFIGSIGFILFSKKFGLFTSINAVYSYIGTIYVSSFAYIFTWNVVNNVCMHYAKPIVLQGIEPESEKGFGTSLKAGFFIFVLTPIVLTIFSYSILVFGGYISSPDSFMHIVYSSQFEKWFKNLILGCLNLFFLILSTYIFYSGIKYQVKEACHGIKLISKANINSPSFIDCAFSNEIDYNVFLTNEAILMFRDLINRMKSITITVEKSSKTLLELWNSFGSTYNEHSVAITYIINTVEVLNELSKELTEKIHRVSEKSNENFNTVDEGVSTIEKSIQNMHDIKNTNDNAILALKVLNEKIKNIDMIVKTIDGIADQTKIIALNAELEAINAGETGRNFGIVANEIRRLADDTTSSISEITGTIDEIQKYSQSLLISSEDRTHIIDNGMNLSYEIEDKFKTIHSSADITASSSSDMEGIISKENDFFSSINKTIENLSKNLQEFAQQSKTLTEACEDLASVSSQISVAIQK